MQPHQKSGGGGGGDTRTITRNDYLLGDYVYDFAAVVEARGGGGGGLFEISSFCFVSLCVDYYFTVHPRFTWM